MKSRKLLLVIFTVVLLAAYYLLGTDFLEQRQEREALTSQIAEANRLKAEIAIPPADLEQRLAAARDNLDTVRNTFPGGLNSTRIINNILELADNVGVKAIPLITQPRVTEGINDNNYSVFRLNIAVTGTFSQLASFLSRLENGELETLILENLTVDRVSGSTGEERDSTAPVNASLDIAIYSQPLNPG